MDAITPSIVIVSNAPKEDLNYDDPDRTITQNTAGDVVFVNDGDSIHVYTQNEYKAGPKCLVRVLGKTDSVIYGHYLGTLYLGK